MAGFCLKFPSGRRAAAKLRKGWGMSDKTKAALQSCQCHYQMFKQEQNTRASSGGQRMSQRKPALTDFIQDFDSSLAFWRWRRLISPCIAELINCPVLSPGFFTDSIPSMISCAIRAVTDCDFAFFEPVAMSTFSKVECKTLYTKNYRFEVLTCKTPLAYRVSYTLLELRCVKSEARQCANTNRASDHNVIGANTMAELQHTQTRPKYTWRFLALNRLDKTAKPCRISVDAETELEARCILAQHFILSLSARLPIQGVYYHD